MSFEQSDQDWDWDKHQFALDANVNGLLPGKGRKDEYKGADPLDAETLRERFRIASTWAIYNATHSITDWHIDAAGSSTHFVVKSGRKAWTVDIDGVVAAVLLNPGDAVVMAPNVLHSVFTPEESVCVGGHGWHVSELAMTQAALQREAKRGSNETIPLWYPAMVQFGMDLTGDESDEAIKQKHGFDDAKLKAFREIVLKCLETDFRQHSGRVPERSLLANGTLADFGWQDVFAVLKICERPAAVVRCRLVKALKDRNRS